MSSVPTGGRTPSILSISSADALASGAPALDADEPIVLRPLVALDDLVGDAGEGARHRLLVHDLGLEPGLFHGTPSLQKKMP